MERTINRVLRFIFFLFFLLYAVVPIIAIPIFAYRVGNWWLLFGVLFSYYGTVSAPTKSSLVIPATLGMIVFWIFQGFSIYQYVTFFYFCALWGFLMYRFAEAYDQERKRGTLDNDEDFMRHYQESKAPIDEKLAEWIKEHPGEHPSYDVMQQLVRSVPMKAETESETK